MAKTTEEDVKLEDRLLRLQRQRILALKEEEIALRKNNALNENGKRILQTNLDIQTQELEVARNTYGALADAVAQRSANILTEETLLGLKKHGLDITAQELDTELAKAKTILQNSVEQQRAQKQANSAAATLLKRTLGVSDAWKGTLAGAIQTGAATGKLVESINLMLDPLDVAMSMFSKISEMSMLAAAEYDSSSAAIRRMAGSHGDLAAQTYASHREMLQYGVTATDAGQAFQSLYQEMAGFSHMSRENGKILRDQVSLLNEVGVAANETTKMFNVLNKGLGMSGPQLSEYSAKLFDMSSALRVAPEVIFKDWNMASKELMKYGHGMVGVLEGLERQSKRTGLAMGDLLGIAKQFDQFDSAGEAVGRLNAILGGPYLNAINMVYMTEDERIQALRETISLSGRVWSSLHRHEQQAIATAAGITDMSVAAQLFGGTQTEFEAAAANQAALQKRAIASQKAMDQMKQAAMGLAIAIVPIVEVFAAIATRWAEIASSPLGATFMTITAALILGFAAYKAYLGVMALAAVKTKAMTILNAVEATATGAVTTAKTAEAGATGLQTSALGALWTNRYGSAASAGVETGATTTLTAAKTAEATATAGVVAGSLESAGAHGADAAAKLASVGPTGAATAANFTLAGALRAVSMALLPLAAGFMIFVTLEAALKSMGPTARKITSILIALASAMALAYAISTGGMGLPVLLAAAAGVAGMMAVASANIESFDNGGKAEKTGLAKVEKKEVVLATHKQSDAAAVAQAQARGDLAPDVGANFEPVIGAINNLISKLNTLMAKADERQRSATREKAVDVTVQLNENAVGEATATWINEHYGIF